MNKSHMTTQELREAMAYLYPGPERGRQRKLAKDVNVTEVSVSRWCSGVTPVGASMARLIRMLVWRQKKLRADAKEKRAAAKPKKLRTAKPKKLRTVQDLI